MEGVLAAWMTPSSLQGGIHGVPWNELPGPMGFGSGRRVTPVPEELTFLQLASLGKRGLTLQARNAGYAPRDLMVFQKDIDAESRLQRNVIAVIKK